MAITKRAIGVMDLKLYIDVYIEIKNVPTHTYPTFFYTKVKGKGKVIPLLLLSTTP
jgi:hypothetical protein